MTIYELSPLATGKAIEEYLDWLGMGVLDPEHYEFWNNATIGEKMYQVHESGLRFNEDGTLKGEF